MRKNLSGALACAILVGFIGCGGAEPPVETQDTARRTAPPPGVTPAPSAKAGPAAAAAVVKVDADSPMTTPGGSAFTAPKGWTVTTKGSVVILEDPNREVSLTFIERKEKTAAAAIAAAWQEVKPGFARAVKSTASWPGRNGWDADEDIVYETTTEEARDVSACARRKGDTWYISLSDGTKDGWGKRRPQSNIAYGSFKAKGVEEESFKGKKANALDEKRLRELEAFIEESRQTMKIPGLAVAVVQGGKVVFEKGFGVRELGKKDPVTPNTLFRIASISKPLTSLMMATLVDDKKFTWDTPATQVLPSFGVGDAELTKRMTMANLVCACTGVPYDNVGTVFESSGVTPEMALEKLKEVKPTTGFGEAFQYSNAMVAAGGFVAAHALQPKKPLAAAFDEAIRAKVLKPLGMSATTFDLNAVKRADHASPHDRTTKFELAVTPISGSEWIAPLNPGGGAWSTVRDFSKYLLMELGNGKTPDGKQVVSEANLLERRKPQGKTSDKTSYGLALDIAMYRDVQVFGHGGGLAGFTSRMFFVPEHGVAAVMLTNVGFPNPFVYQAFQRKLFELLFDGRDEAKEDLAIAMKTQESVFLKEMGKVELEPEKAWIERFVGTYEHATYGKITIRLEGNRGVLDAGEWQASLGRKKEADGTFKLVTTSAPWTRWPEFIIKDEGGKVRLLLEDGQRKVWFEPAKKAEAPKPKTSSVNPVGLDAIATVK